MTMNKLSFRESIKQKILLKENEMLVTPHGFYIYSSISKQFTTMHKGEKIRLFLSDEKDILKTISPYIRRESHNESFSSNRQSIRNEKSYYPTKKACKILSSQHYNLGVEIPIEDTNIIYYTMSPIQDRRT